jgi:hypothetical protein
MLEQKILGQLHTFLNNSWISYKDLPNQGFNKNEDKIEDSFKICQLCIYQESRDYKTL